MKLSLDERNEVIKYLEEHLKSNGFIVRTNKYGSITKVFKNRIACTPSLCDSAREGKNSFTFIQLEAGRYSPKDLGFYQDASKILSKYSNNNESAVDMRNYKKRVDEFVKDLQLTYDSIFKKHEDLKENSNMNDEINFENINDKHILELSDKQCEKVAEIYWNKDIDAVIKYLGMFHKNIENDFHNSLLDRMSTEGYDSDFPWEDADTEELRKAFEIREQVFREILKKYNSQYIIDAIDDYWDDNLMFDDVEDLLNTSMEVLSEDTDNSDEVELVPLEVSGLVDWLSDELAETFGNNYGEFEYLEDDSDEPEMLQFSVDDNAENYAGEIIIVLSDSRADKEMESEIRIYVEDLLPDLLDSGNITDLEDYLDEDWFDKYRRDWYEEYIYSMSDEDLINELIDNDLIEDCFRGTDIIKYEDEEIDVQETADNLTWRDRDDANEYLINHYCDMHSSSIDWYLDYVGSYDLKYLVKDNPDAFDTEKYVQHLIDSSYDRGEWISHYDGREEYLGTFDGTSYYAYVR